MESTGQDTGRTFEVVNLEQAADWDGVEGERWVAHADGYESTGARFARRLLDPGRIRVTDRVLDIGCGIGTSTRGAARLAVEGSALGVDLSGPMLAEGRRRVAADGPANVEFVQGDAQVYPFPAGAFDVVISRFGSMFFADPVAAFGNIGTALRSGGTLNLVAWRELDRNPWLLAIREACAQGRDLPVPPPHAPSAFALADPEHVRRVLTAAGFTDVAFSEVDEQVCFGADPDSAFDFIQGMGLVLGLLSGLDEPARTRALANLRDVMTAHATPDGVLLDGSAWLITARRP